MAEAILVWALALYGATVLVYQSVVAIGRRTESNRSIAYILIVNNAEERIEGVLRTLELRTMLRSNKRHIIVIDADSRDATRAIVLKMAQKHPDIEYYYARDEEAVVERLRSACLTTPVTNCVYDLRVDVHQGVGQNWV